MSNQKVKLTNSLIISILTVLTASGMNVKNIHELNLFINGTFLPTSIPKVPEMSLYQKAQKSPGNEDALLHN